MDCTNEQTIKNTKSEKEYWFYPIFVFVSFAFLAVFSSDTSPLFSSYGGDSSIFIMLGKMFLEGRTPYVDFFDHKGPIIIFIEAIGLSFSSNERLSIFISQAINLTIVQVLIYRCARCMLSPINSLVIVFSSLLVFSITMNGGNMTEEYSLPFLFASLLFTLKFQLHKQDIKAYQLFIVGLSAGILFWMRPNNAGAIFATMLFVFVVLCQHKEWKKLIKQVVFILLGLLTISLVIVLYFIKIDAFDEMIYASFTFNLKYLNISLEEKENQSVGRFVINNIKSVISLLILAIGAVVYYIKNKDKKLFLLSAILLMVGLLTTHIGKVYPHYMTLNLPCFVLGAMMLLLVANKNFGSENFSRNSLILASIALLGYMIAKYNLPLYQKTKNDSSYIEQVRQIVNPIPKADYDSVYAYGVYAHFWLISDIMPSYKYFTSHEWHGSHDKKIFTEINEMMQNNSPKWLIMPVDNDKFNRSFLKIVAERYTLYDANKKYELYKLE